MRKEKELDAASMTQTASLTSASLLVSCPFCLKRMHKFSLNLRFALVHKLEKLLTLTHAFLHIRQTYLCLLDGNLAQVTVSNGRWRKATHGQMRGN
jgi:hypothetical protein